MNNNNYPLLMTEDIWTNTYLSIARHCGGIMLDNREYIIVDKRGRDLFECSIIAEREGRQKAIEPGEPAVRVTGSSTADAKTAGNTSTTTKTN